MYSAAEHKGEHELYNRTVTTINNVLSVASSEVGQMKFIQTICGYSVECVMFNVLRE